MHFILSQLHLSQLNEIFFLFVEMKIELSTLSPVTTSTIHQEITTLKRKRKEGSVLLFSISIIVLLPTVFPY